MAGPYGGNTVMGDMLNKQHSAVLRGNLDRYNRRRARIKRSYNGTYFFFLDPVDKDGTPISKPIRVTGDPTELAAMYGEPDEMIGMEVEVTYRGPSINRGRARVLGPSGGTMATEIHDVEHSNKLERQGTSFAPPGGGIM